MNSNLNNLSDGIRKKKNNDRLFGKTSRTFTPSIPHSTSEPNSFVENSEKKPSESQSFYSKSLSDTIASSSKNSSIPSKPLTVLSILHSTGSPILQPNNKNNINNNQNKDIKPSSVFFPGNQDNSNIKNNNNNNNNNNKEIKTSKSSSDVTIKKSKYPAFPPGLSSVQVKDAKSLLHIKNLINTTSNPIKKRARRSLIVKKSGIKKQKIEDSKQNRETLTLFDIIKKKRVISKTTKPKTLLKKKQKKSEKTKTQKPENPTLSTNKSSSSSSGTVVAPAVQAIDGKIVVDQSSLIVHSNLPTSDGYPTVYESGERTKHITSATYSKRQPAERWTAEENTLFFKALEYFGTDLSMISQCFNKRSRKQIRNKFKKEEKDSPEKIEDALKSKHSISEIEEFRKKIIKK